MTRKVHWESSKLNHDCTFASQDQTCVVSQFLSLEARVSMDYRREQAEEVEALRSIFDNVQGTLYIHCYQVMSTVSEADPPTVSLPVVSDDGARMCSLFGWAHL
jgi:hypothetical protein